MAEARELFGLPFWGNYVMDVALSQGRSVAVAANKEALGVPLCIDLCTCDFSDVPNQPGDGKLISVVIGDPYLLVGVKVVDRYRKDSSDLPDDVRSALYPYDAIRSDSHNEVIVFENADGELIYVEACYTTLLENADYLIDSELLEVVLKDA